MPEHALREPGILWQLGALTGVLAQPAKAGRCGANRAGDVEVIAWPATTPRQDSPWAYGSDHGHVHDQRPRRPRDIPADQRDVAGICQLDEPVEQAIDVGEGEIRRQDERQQRIPRRGAHSGDIADVDGKSLVPDVGWGREAAVEMDAFDERIGRQDLQGAAIRCRDCGIVADADDDRGRRRRQSAANMLDESALADVPNRPGPGGEWLGATGRSQRPASRG